MFSPFVHGILGSAESCDCTPNYVTGDRTASITVSASTNIVFDGGPLTNLVDGSFAADAGGSLDEPGVGATAIPLGAYVRFAFAMPVKLTGAKVYKHQATSNGPWKWQGSTDASGWTDLGSFTWNSTAITTPLTEAVVTHAQMIATSSTALWSNSWFQEVEFQTCNC